MRKLLSLAVLLIAVAAGPAFAQATAAPVKPVPHDPSALLQADDLPEGFADALFDTPLAIRIELDGHYFGDAMVVLGRDQHLQLTDMLEGSDSPLPQDLRRDVETLLRKGIQLGVCTGLACPGGIVRSAFSLADSRLALFTDHPASATASQRYYEPPRQGSGGVLLDHNLSLAASPGGDTGSASYNLSLTSDIGSWTAYSNLQLDYERSESPDGHGSDERLRTYLDNAYLQKNFRGYYVRGGYFTPNTSTDQGNLAPLPFARNSTMAGFSFGSSDTLLKPSNRPSMIPLTVSANKAGRIELYKDGRLIGTYPSQPGLNDVPTENLPDGIYTVEVRVFEDNKRVASTQERIYKPANWNGSDRWHFRLYGGHRLSLGDGNDDTAAGNPWIGGAQLGYLFHPAFRGGITVQHDGAGLPVGLFAHYDINDNAELYLNPYYSSRLGYGYEAQGILRTGPASVVFTHSYAERRARTLDDSDDTTASRVSSLSASWRIDRNNRLSTRLSYDHVHARRTLDLSYHHDLVTRRNLQIQAYVSVSERPGTGSQAPSRGIMFGISGTFGSGGHHFNASVGANRDGSELGRSLNLNYQRSLENSPIQSFGIAGNYARNGSSATATAQFANRYLNGDGYLQYGTASHDTSLGLNLHSTMAIGGGAAVLSAQNAGNVQSAVLLDLKTDADLPGDSLVARLNDGGSVTLHRGRNLIPVDPYKVEHLSFDLGDGHRGGAHFQPATATVQLYPGDVVRQQVEVMRTVTVVGRLIGPDGQAKKGVQIRNHAGRTWPENDGVFTLELSRRHPTIDVFDGDHKQCTLDLRDRLNGRDDGVAVLGDLPCA